MTSNVVINLLGNTMFSGLQVYAKKLCRFWCKISTVDEKPLMNSESLNHPWPHNLD